MKRAFVGLVALVTLLIIIFYGLGLYSNTGSPRGLTEQQLAPCPNKPNCVSSESSIADDHAITAMKLTPNLGQEPLLKVQEVIELLGGKMNYTDENYLASTFTSDLFRFVDDVEFRVDKDKGLLHVRSASRVGYSDLNANRKRVEQIRTLLGNG